MAAVMSTADLIIMAAICLLFLFYFRKKRRKNEEPEKKSEHNTDGKGNQGDQTGAIPVIHVIFQKEVEEEELAAEIADMYLHGRAFYYTGKHATDTRKEDTVYVRHKVRPYAVHIRYLPSVYLSRVFRCNRKPVRAGTCLLSLRPALLPRPLSAR